MSLKTFMAFLILLGGIATPIFAIAEQLPIPAGNVTALDIPQGSADVFRIEIQKGRFSEQSVDKLNLLAEGIDFRQGSLKQLTADLQNAQFDTLKVDAMHLVTGGFSFDPMSLLNQHRFVLNRPVDGTVQLKISESNLNNYFTNPKTLEKLEKAANKKMGNIGLLQLSNPNITLLGKNRLKAILNVSLGGASSSPVDMIGQLNLNAGKIVLSDVQLTSNGVLLPFDLAGVFTTKFNEAIDFERLGKKAFVIKANKLVTNGKAIDVAGTVQLTRLEFGAAHEG